MPSPLLKTETRKKWKIFRRKEQYFFKYKKNKYHLANAKSKEECHVFTDNENNFVILISNENEDFAALVYLNLNCEVLWEKNFTDVNDYWKKTSPLKTKKRAFFTYKPIFQARILFIGKSMDGNTKPKEQIKTSSNNIPLKKVSEKTIETPPEDFFKDWKPFSIGFCIGVLFSVISFMLFSTWNC